MEYTSLSWSDIPELVGLMMISVIECYCMTWLIVTKYLCHKGPRYIPFVVITIQSVLSSIMTFQRGCSKTNATCDTCGAGIAYPSGAFEPTPGFSGVCVARSFVFYIALGRLLFDFFLPLFCLRFRFIAPDYPFGIPKRHRYNQETLTPFGNTRHRTNTKGQSRMDNQETLTPFGYTRHRTMTKRQSRDTDIILVHKTQDEDKGTINNRRSRDTDIIWVHKTQNEDAWTIKRHWHHWVHKIHDEGKGTIKNGQSRDTDTIWVQKSQDKDKDAIKNYKKKLLLVKIKSGIAPF